jgi:hypothetical protein
MFVKDILIVEIFVVAKVAKRMSFLLVLTYLLEVVEFLLEHEDWLVFDAKLTKSLLMLLLVMLAKRLLRRELSYWLSVTEMTNITKFSTNRNLH